jgi:hypothetical protein
VVGHSKDTPTQIFFLYPEFDADSESAISFQYRLIQNGDNIDSLIGYDQNLKNSFKVSILCRI